MSNGHIDPHMSNKPKNTRKKNNSKRTPACLKEVCECFTASPGKVKISTTTKQIKTPTNINTQPCQEV